MDEEEEDFENDQDGEEEIGEDEEVGNRMNQSTLFLRESLSSQNFLLFLGIRNEKQAAKCQSRRPARVSKQNKFLKYAKVTC